MRCVWCVWCVWCGVVCVCGVCGVPILTQYCPSAVSVLVSRPCPVPCQYCVITVIYTLLCVVSILFSLLWPILPSTLFQYCPQHCSNTALNTVPILPPILFQYCFITVSSIVSVLPPSTVSVLPPVLFQYCASTVSVLF